MYIYTYKYQLLSNTVIDKGYLITFKLTLKYE